MYLVCATIYGLPYLASVKVTFQHFAEEGSTCNANFVVYYCWSQKLDRIWKLKNKLDFVENSPVYQISLVHQ